MEQDTAGCDAMSVFEVVMIVFGAISVVIALIKLMVYIADKFSQRKCTPLFFSISYCLTFWVQFNAGAAYFFCVFLT